MYSVCVLFSDKNEEEDEEEEEPEFSLVSGSLLPTRHHMEDGGCGL